MLIRLATVLAATAAASLMIGAATAHAEEPENKFSGFKIGANLSWDRLSVDRDVAGVTPRIDAGKGGIGGRGFIGYDVAIGPVVLGAEAGIGIGGRTPRQDVTGGRYGVDPGLSWDLSARAGVAVDPSVLLYGRVGYRWQRTATGLVQGAETTRRTTTEGGLTFGGGAEFAVSDRVALRAEYMRTNFGGGLKGNQFRLGASLRF
jgi:opacity protein-like surface antigen